MAIKGFEKQDPMAGLNQLMQMMNQMDTMNARKERSHLIMHEEIGQGLNKIYNNEQLATRKNHLDKYLQENNITIKFTVDNEIKDDILGHTQRLSSSKHNIIIYQKMLS